VVLAVVAVLAFEVPVETLKDWAEISALLVGGVWTYMLFIQAAHAFQGRLSPIQ
jgi:hypothetical protein